MLKFEVKGDDRKTRRFLSKMKSQDYLKSLEAIAEMGVAALASATPKASGTTASSWSYEIKRGSGSTSIVWKNSNMHKGVPIAVILQYGHGTGTGGWVQGRDYINPAMRPVFDRLAESAWRVVQTS